MMNLNVIIVIIYSVLYDVNAATTSAIPHITKSTLTTASHPTTLDPTTLGPNSRAPTTPTSESRPTTISTTFESTSTPLTNEPTTPTSYTATTTIFAVPEAPTSSDSSSKSTSSATKAPTTTPSEPLFPPPRIKYNCIPTDGQPPKVKLTCDTNSNDYVTVPQAVFLGYLPANVTCSDNFNVTGCEQYHSNVQYVGHGDSPGDLGNIAGKAPAWHPLAIAGNNMHCNRELSRKSGDYNVIHYDCINKNDVSTLCGSDNRTSEFIYVWSYSYPRDMGLAERCRCQIHTSASQIVVQMYDNRMHCSQSLTLTDGKNALHRWSCDVKFNHMTNSTFQIPNGTFTLNWDGGNDTNVASTGKVFIRLRATDRSPLSIQCLGHGPSSSKVLPTDDIIHATKSARECSKLNTNFVTLQCPPGQVVGLHSIALGFLNNNETCSIDKALQGCEQDHNKYQYLGSPGDSDDKGDLEKVSGNNYYQSSVAKQGVSGKCIPRSDEGLTLTKNADYIAAYYDCIEKTDITTMCQPSHRQDDTVYIWNDGYPDNGDFKERTCQCSINTTAAKVVVQTYDNRLLCSQRLELRQDNGKTLLMPWRCDPDFHHILTDIVSTDGAPFTLDWKSNNETSRAKTGKFWIRIRAFNDTKAKMSTQCFEPVYPTTTTTEAPTTPTTTPKTTVPYTGTNTLGVDTKMTPTPHVMTSKNPAHGNNSKETQTATETYCIPRYIVYAVCGGFGGVLLIFIVGCIIMSKRTSGPDVNAMASNIEMGRMEKRRSKEDFTDMIADRPRLSAPKKKHSEDRAHYKAAYKVPHTNKGYDSESKNRGGSRDRGESRPRGEPRDRGESKPRGESRDRGESRNRDRSKGSVESKNRDRDRDRSNISGESKNRGESRGKDRSRNSTESKNRDDSRGRTDAKPRANRKHSKDTVDESE